MKNVNLTINGKAVAVPEGTTILEAAKKIGIHIPTLCYLENVHKYGGCRICVVEVKGAKALVASCMVAASEGMKVETNSERVRKARKLNCELLLSDHPQDCLSCSRSGSCELQTLANSLGLDRARFKGERSPDFIDISPSVTRDAAKCILCRRCVSVCNNIQKVGILNAQNRGFRTIIAPAGGAPLSEVNCTYCGQCVNVCPVNALRETDALAPVWRALADPKKRVVVQTAPAVRVALGEEFGLPAGTPVTGKMASALRALRFDDIFDTNIAADLTIMEEGTELLHRAKAALTEGKAALPMVTSCSPGWVKFVEHEFPDLLGNVSTCKSPHMMLGALAKSYYAQKLGADPGDMFVVSVMPCTAKKFEVTRPEMQANGIRDVDAVLTTRELARMIREAGIDFVNLPDEDFDSPLGISTGAADIFGVTGGVMEAALRTVYELVTGRELPFDGLHVQPICSFDQVRDASIRFEDVLPEYKFLEGFTLNIAVTSGFAGARRLMEEVRGGRSKYHFIEVMGCPGGCIVGGGQPRSADPMVREKRRAGLFSEDERKDLRKSHKSPVAEALYKEFLGSPCGHKSHELLHTHYTERGTFNELIKK